MTEPVLRIPLTKGYECVVDWDDLWAIQFKWCVMLNRSTNGERPYAVRTANGQRIYLHREIAGLPPSDPRDVDHRDGDTLNNRRDNLRPASRSLNNLNRTSAKGVYYHKTHRLWQAYINIHGKRRNLGWFKTEGEALDARANAKEEILAWLK